MTRAQELDAALAALDQKYRITPEEYARERAAQAARKAEHQARKAREAQTTLETASAVAEAEWDRDHPNRGWRSC